MKHLRIFDHRSLCGSAGPSWFHVPAATCGACLVRMDDLLNGGRAAIITEGGLKYFEVDRRVLQVRSDSDNTYRKPDVWNRYLRGGQLSALLKTLWSQQRIVAMFAPPISYIINSIETGMYRHQPLFGLDRSADVQVLPKKPKVP